MSINKTWPISNFTSAGDSAVTPSQMLLSIQHARPNSEFRKRENFLHLWRNRAGLLLAPYGTRGRLLIGLGERKEAGRSGHRWATVQKRPFPRFFPASRSLMLMHHGNQNQHFHCACGRKRNKDQPEVKDRFSEEFYSPQHCRDQCVGNNEKWPDTGKLERNEPSRCCCSHCRNAKNHSA
jgi:hypothetical protein